MNFLDKKTREKIGLFYVMDKLHVYSAFGRNKFRKLKPIKDESELLVEYDNIEASMEAIKEDKCLSDFQNLFMRFRDIENTFKKCAAGEILDEVELFEVKNFVLVASELRQLYLKHSMKLKGIVLRDFEEIYRLLNPLEVRTSSFLIYNAYSERLLKLRNRKKEIEKLIYLEGDNEKRRELLRTRAELANEEKDEEFVIRRRLSTEISKYTEEIFREIEDIGKLDITIAKAKEALQSNLCRPSLAHGIKIVNGINPMVRDNVIEKGGSFQPISLEVEAGTSVITGANMGGKSVVLSIIALNYLLASMGFYVFADKFEFIPLDFLYFLSEDGESLQNGLSTFGAEIIKLKSILESIKKQNGLIILDEFARGTNPEEGSNITKALVRYLNRFPSISVISTHYDGVCEYAGVHYEVKGLKNAEFDIATKIEREEDFLMLINSYMDYSLEKVEKHSSIPRDALNICRLMGIDEEIIDMIKEGYYGK